MQDAHYFGIDDEGSICARINRRLLAGILWFFCWCNCFSCFEKWLKNDWETTVGKCSLCFDPFTWVFWAVKQCATIYTFYLVICWLFSTFCNQDLYSSFFSHMSWKFYMLLLTLFLTEKGRFQKVFCLLVESKERLFHRFTSNFLNRNSSWQKLHMKPTLQKIPGYKDEISWKTSLWRHKGTSVNILYIKI